jgi:hypothetical protein
MMSQRVRSLVAVALVALAVLGGTARALAATVPNEGNLERQPELPTAPPRPAPAGDQRGTAVVTDAALLIALAARPIRRRGAAGPEEDQMRPRVRAVVTPRRAGP